MAHISHKHIENQGVLYVVATPIGNFADMTERAVKVLSDVDLILAEDTRRTKPLLQRFAISASKIMSFHEHNEERLSQSVIEKMLSGTSVALVSDAGTPLISDPGYGLVAAAHHASIKVEPIPGACALIAALSAGGLPTDQFFFAGFLPAKSMQRIQALKTLRDQQGTLIFYESSHRIQACLLDCVNVLGARKAVIAREITKLFETIKQDNLQGLLDFVNADSNQQKGEFVVLIEGSKPRQDSNLQEIDRLLGIMMEELPLKQAAKLVAKMLGLKKNSVYQRALELK